MKPDKHKKKQSSQYKRKHGIKSDNDNTLGKSKDRNSAPNSKGGNTRDAGPGWGSTNPGPESHGHASRSAKERPSTSDDCLEDAEGLATDVPRKKNFERRQITSNWERYDGSARTTAESELTKGSDFKLVLQSAGGAVSQFRFQDEIDWELDGDVGSNADLLSIDCQDIAAAMECIPLHVRLDIEPSAFQEEHLRLFEEEANRKKLAYNARATSAEHGSGTSLGMPAVTRDSRELSERPATEAKGPACLDTDQASTAVDHLLDEILHLGNGGMKSSMTTMVTEVVASSERDGDATSPAPAAELEKLKLVDAEEMLSSILGDTTAGARDEEDSVNCIKSDPGVCPILTNVDTISDSNTPVDASPTNPPDADTRLEKKKLVDISAGNNSSSLSNRSLGVSKIPDEPTNKSSIEDDLDFLLSLDTNSKPTASATEPKTSDADQLDDWLDDLLDN